MRLWWYFITDLQRSIIAYKYLKFITLISSKSKKMILWDFSLKNISYARTLYIPWKTALYFDSINEKDILYNYYKSATKRGFFGRIHLNNDQNALVASFCFHFLLLFGEIVISLRLDNLVNCIWILETNASVPLFTPSLLVGFMPANKGDRVGKEARHNEGVYLTLCLRHTGISQITVSKSWT